MPFEKPKRSCLQRIEDMLQAIDDIQAFVTNCDFSRFCSDKMLRYAVTRALEIISEASRHLPDDLKARHPAIDWRGIAAVGNVYRHAYDGVDEAFVWDVVERDLQPLRAALAEEAGRAG